MNIYTEQNILMAIFGSIGLFTALFVLTYSFVWQGREEIKLKRTTNDSPKEADEIIRESWKCYLSCSSTEGTQKTQ